VELPASASRNRRMPARICLLVMMFPDLKFRETWRTH
jgi:hypothetical protein